MAQARSIITWQDVGMLIRAVEKEHNVYLVVTMEIVNKWEKDHVTFTIAARAYSRTVAGKGKVVASETTHFPQRRYASVPGAFVDLVYGILRKVEAVEAEAQALGQNPLAF